MGNSKNYLEVKNRKLEIIDAHLGAARSYAKLSRSRRLQVGAVIVKDDRIVSVGYNGMPSGGSNICETLSRDGDNKSMKGLSGEDINSHLQNGYELVTKPEVIHAEENAILFAAKNGIATEGCSMVMTHSPCMSCAKMIIQSGIKNLYYYEEYRNTSPLGFLKSHGVKVNSIS